MPTPITGVTFNSIQTEFGGANPISMSEYRRGGVNVLTGQATSGTDGVAISTTGAIRVGMFRGLTKTSAVSATPNRSWSVSYTTLGSTAASATFGVNSLGGVFETGAASSDGFLITSNTWYTPTTAGIGNSFWIRATQTNLAGTALGAAIGTWISMANNVSWGVSRGAQIGTSTRNLTLEISSNSAGTAIVSTSTVSISSNRDI